MYYFFERNIQASDATPIHNTIHCGYDRDGSLEMSFLVIFTPILGFFPNMVVSVLKNHMYIRIFSPCQSLAKGESVKFLMI